MSFLVPVLGAVAGGIASAGASKLFSGSSNQTSPSASLRGFTPTNFSGGGLSSTFGNNGVTVMPSADRSAAVGSIANTFGNQAAATGGLLQKVAPGMNDLLRTRLSALSNARSSALGDLRENLAKRRVLGSSFGQDALARADAEFAQQQDQITADNFLKSLDLTNQLQQQQFEAQRGQFQTGLDELNLEANLAAQLSSAASNSLASNAQTAARLDALEQQNAGKFAGQLAQPIGAGVSKGITSLFGGDSGNTISFGSTPAVATANGGFQTTPFFQSLAGT